MINNPLLVEITSSTGKYKAVELFPIYRELHERYEPTASVRLFNGYTPEDSEFSESIAGIEQYMDNIDFMGDSDPHYIGTLHFTGIGLLEWRYEGGRLTEFEVVQVIENLWTLRTGSTYIEPVGSSKYNFPYEFEGQKLMISVVEMESGYGIYIDNCITAIIAFDGSNWDFCWGDIENEHLRGYTIRYIRAIIA